MNRMPKNVWYCITPILLLVAFSTYIAIEIVILRRIPAVLGRLAPFLTFWSNIIISLALRPDESIPIWIVPVLNLCVLFVVIVVYEMVIPALRSCTYEGERK